MKSLRLLAYVVALSVLLGILASTAIADKVYCRPLLRDGRLIGFCFTVCNVPGPNTQDPCDMQGCIYDLHLRILSSNCMFMKILRLPPNWDGVIGPPGPSPWFHAKTPPATGAAANPIKIGYCQTFCLYITPRCMSPGACIKVLWWTTDDKGLARERGVVECCWPAPVAAGS